MSGLGRNHQRPVSFRHSSVLDGRFKYNKDEPVHEKTNNLVFQPGLTQTRLYSHRRWLEAGNFGFRKKRNCTIPVAKTKALISFAVTAKLISAFVFAYADCWFSHAAAQISKNRTQAHHV